MKTIEAPKPTKGALIFGLRFLESEGQANEVTREVPVLIIKEGMGNKADRHVYSKALLEKVAPLFDGVKAYADHPSKTEEKDRPERSVKEVVGYYHTPRIVMVEGKAAIAATLKIMDGASYEWAWSLVKEAAAFAKRFKDKDLVGISINAWGASHAVETEAGIVNLVDDLTEVQSADIVTQAGAGGGFRLREAIKKALAREGQPQQPQEGTPMKDLLMKHGEGLKGLRAAVKADPAHEAAYGPAVDELMGHQAEMMKSCEAAPAPKPAAPDAPALDAASVEAAKKAEGEKTFEQMQESYKAGKMTPAEKRLFEMLSQDRAATRIKENAAMIERLVRESGIPEAYSDDLRVLCVGKDEADVKRLVESRKSLIASISGPRAEGAGGAEGKKAPASKLKEALASAGVKMQVKA